MSVAYNAVKKRRLVIKYTCRGKSNIRNERSRYVEIFHMSAFFMQCYIHTVGVDGRVLGAAATNEMGFRNTKTHLAYHVTGISKVA